MREAFSLTTERVDDLPVLAANMEKIGVAGLVDKHFVSHGNWEGINLGRVCCGWLVHILSEADHRMR